MLQVGFRPWNDRAIDISAIDRCKIFKDVLFLMGKVVNEGMIFRNSRIEDLKGILRGTPNSELLLWLGW